MARLGLLPKKTLAALSGPDGQLLAQIATARDLGAPAVIRSSQDVGSGSGRGLAGAVAGTLGTGPSIALIAALAGIVVAGAWARRRRSSARLI